MKDLHSQEKNMGQSMLPQVTVDYITIVFTVIFFAGCFAIDLFGVEISSEARNQYYNIHGTLSYTIYLVLNTLYGRHYGLNWIKSLVFSCANLFFLFFFIAFFHIVSFP